VPAFMNLIGTRFGRLLVKELAPKLRSGAQLKTRWACQCDCGTVVTVSASELRVGCTQSCGCLQRERAVEARTVHGESPRNSAKEPEYIAWRNMISRCQNPNRKDFKHYGGRGIIVCSRWLIGEDGIHPYLCFLADMKRRPSPEHSIDRYPDNDGNYEPDNCRWATQFQQVHNRRKPVHQKDSSHV